MSSLTAAYDPAWDALFGKFNLIPSLKPRPGAPQPGEQRRRAPRRSLAGGPSGIIANSLLTNQAVVKVVRGGGVTEAGRLGGQLSYITRKGSVEMERGDTGELTTGIEGLRDVQKEWAQDWARMDARTTNYTYHVIVSYPKDTDREAAKQAARRFGERLTNGEFGDRYKYVMAHHDDTGHPHTHLVINRAGASGKTLQLSRYGITTQDLRDLQVETARDVGIVLNATSRFSRNVAPEYESSARIHARRDGRDLRERPSPERRTGFPFLGRGRQQPITPDRLQELQDQRNAEYTALGETLRSHQGGVMRGIFTTQYPGRAETLGSYSKAVLGAANTLLRGGVLTKEEHDVNQQVAHDLDPAQAAGVDTELKAIGSDIRTFIKGMSDKADEMEDEDKRSQTEAAISRVLRDYEPLMDDETKAFFGKRLERDDDIEVGRDDIDPTRQRRAAVRDAEDPTRTQDLGQARENADDPRGLATKAALAEADSKVEDRFEAMGISGNLALSRIRNGADVDRETREKWFERDVQTLANAHSLSEKQAREDMKAAYKDAAEIYRDARGEIRDINRAFAEDRGDEFMSAKVKQGMEAEFKQLKSFGYTDADIGGRLLEIEAVVSDKVLGYVPDDLKEHVPDTVRLRSKDRETAPDRSETKSRETGEATRAPEPAAAQSKRPDFKDGVRGEIVVTGTALFDKEDKDSLSPYIDLKVEGRDKPVRAWGVDLPDMMERQNLNVGDTATIAHDGYKMVNVKKVDKETGEERTIETKRRAWKASDVEKAPLEQERIQPSLSERAASQERTDPGRTERTQRQEVSVETGVTGVIIDAKEALARPDDPSSQSFYVDMKVDGKDEPQRIWGTALQDQMERNNISIGDNATFIPAGKEEVTRSVRNSVTDEPERVNITRKAWDVKDIDRRIDRDPDVQERRRREREDRAKGDRSVSR